MHATFHCRSRVCFLNLDLRENIEFFMWRHQNMRRQPPTDQWPLLWCYTYNHNEYFCWVFNVGNWRDKDVLVCLALTTLNLLYLYTERKWRLIRLLQTTDQRTLDRFQAYKKHIIISIKIRFNKENNVTDASKILMSS